MKESVLSRRSAEEKYFTSKRSRFHQRSVGRVQRSRRARIYIYIYTYIYIYCSTIRERSMNRLRSERMDSESPRGFNRCFRRPEVCRYAEVSTRLLKTSCTCTLHSYTKRARIFLLSPEVERARRDSPRKVCDDVYPFPSPSLCPAVSFWPPHLPMPATRIVARIPSLSRKGI